MKTQSRLRIAALLVVTGLMTSLPGKTVAQGGDWQEPRNLSNSRRDSEAPSIAADPAGNVHVVWCESVDLDRCDTIYYTGYDDNAWSTPMDIVYVAGQVADTPVLGVDPAGILHLVWLGGFSNEVFYSQAYAHAAGSARNWSAAVPVSEMLTGTKYPDLVVDRDGNPHVAYTVFSGEARGVYYAFSPDGGDTWSRSMQVDAKGGRGWLVDRARLAVDERGGIHVVWTEYEAVEPWPSLGMRYASSLNGGETWRKPLSIEGPFDYGGITTVGDAEIHIVWSGTWYLDKDARDRSKYHRWSEDQGRNWSSIGRTLRVGGFQGWPSLATDSAGQVHLFQVASGQRPDKREESLFYQTWKGEQWSDPQILVSRLEGAPSHPSSLDATVALGNELHVVVQHIIENPAGVGTWFYDIFYFRGTAAAPPLELQTLVPPTMQAPPTAAAPAVEIAETATAQPTSAASAAIGELPRAANRAPVSVVLLGVAPVVLLIGCVVAAQLMRRV